MKDYTEATSRIWHLVCYDEKVLHAICEKSTRWAYILHDKDTLEDGSPKPPHYHVYSYRRNDTKGNFYVKLGRTISPDNGTVRVAVQTNGHDAVEYFQHADERSKEAKKTPYPLESVVFDVKGNDNHFKSQEEREAELEKNRASQEADNLAFLNDIIVHRSNPVTLAIRYGRSYIANKSKYDSFVCELIQRTDLPDEELLSDEAKHSLALGREYDATFGNVLKPNLELGNILVAYEEARHAYLEAFKSRDQNLIDSRSNNLKMLTEIRFEYLNGQNYHPDYLEECKAYYLIYREGQNNG